MRKLIFSTVLMTVSLIPVMAGAETDYREWQLDRIHSPTQQQLARERAGRVNIYDGLRDSDVRHALETQFDRAENMMFVRTVVTDDAGAPVQDEQTGEYVAEDDDC